MIFYSFQDEAQNNSNLVTHGGDKNRGDNLVCAEGKRESLFSIWEHDTKMM